jgi:hypothetical protein
MNTTTIETRAEILAELWLNYRDDEDFEDFVSYNDLGLPLSYMLTAKIVKTTEMADKFVNETFDLLLASLEIEDTGFDSLDDIFIASTK